MNQNTMLTLYLRRGSQIYLRMLVELKIFAQLVRIPSQSTC